MSRAVFRVYGSRQDLDGATEATVVIDREAQLVTVRPLRRRRVYQLPLAWVAGVIIHRVAKAERAERIAAKKRGRR